MCVAWLMKYAEQSSERLPDLAIRLLPCRTLEVRFSPLLPLHDGYQPCLWPCRSNQLLYHAILDCLMIVESFARLSNPFCGEDGAQCSASSSISGTNGDAAGTAGCQQPPIRHDAKLTVDALTHAGNAESE